MLLAGMMMSPLLLEVMAMMQLAGKQLKMTQTVSIIPR